ncbi:MAG: hypothetical protein K2J90_14080 [Lachnospiraceae bacterium]|nr:hypothetical protein [Lachnospiraceae bacterium]
MKIREFLRLRKQNDTVKLMCFFVLAGAGFFVNVLYHAGKLCHSVQSPVEYQLVRGSTVTNEQIRELAQSDGVAAVSRSLDIPVTVKYQGQETMMTCTMLSKAYIEKVYGIMVSGSEKRYYMNQAAFREIQTGFMENNVSLEKGDVTEFGEEYKIQYQEEGEKEENMLQKAFHSARILVIKEKTEKETVLICTEEDGTRLSKADSVRVLFSKHDLDGMRQENLTKMGYEIQNEQMLHEEEYEMKIRLFHIRYGILICAVCLVTLHYMKKSVTEYRHYD